MVALNQWPSEIISQQIVRFCFRWWADEYMSAIGIFSLQIRNIAGFGPQDPSSSLQVQDGNLPFAGEKAVQLVKDELHC